MKRVFNQNKKSRIWEIDFLRGLPIIGLVLYHLGYDFIMLPYVFSNFYAMGNLEYINLTFYKSIEGFRI